MRKNLYIIAFMAIAMIFPVQAQVTGLSNVRLFIDPGHSQRENMGVSGWSEAETVLRVSLAIEEMLLQYTDMRPENIRLSRRNDQQSVTLVQRTDAANAFGAHFLLSVHSDASGNQAANTTLFMYPGMRQVANGPVFERAPHGGKKFGDFLANDLTGIMRTVNNDGVVRPVGTRGNVACLVFYNNWASPPTRLIPWLHMLREANMAANLTENGFHTNPVQNQQKMNSEWWRLEAYANFQSLVRFLTSQFGEDGAQEPPQVGIATGFVFDSETNRTINAATIKLTGRESGKEATYITDCYATLFNRFAAQFRPREMSNGFFWVEGFQPGEVVDAVISAPGFQTANRTVTIPLNVGSTTREGLGFLDVALVNATPAVVSNVGVNRDMNGNVIQRHPVEISFSRNMNRASVEQAFSISPTANYTLSWVNDFTLRVNITQLAFETTYTITIDGSIARNSQTNDLLDGNGDGIPGGNFVFVFTTSDYDLDPPVIVSYDPRGAQEEALRPIVRIQFDEFLNEATTHGKIIVTDAVGNQVAGRQTYHETANFKSVLHFIFEGDLTPNTTYTVKVLAGIEDLHGNAIKEDFEFTFTPRPRPISSSTMLHNFGTVDGFWDPGQSGSTNGIDAGITLRSLSPIVGNSTNATSLRLDYLFTLQTGTIRMHRPPAAMFAWDPNNTLQFYVFGDGSGSMFRITVRFPNSTSIWSSVPIALDWVGWRLITWNPVTDPRVEWLTAANAVPAIGTMVSVSDIGLHPANPYSTVPSFILIDEIRVVQFARTHYTVSFDTQGGTAVAPVEVPVGQTVLKPQDPTKAGHEFEGWYYSFIPERDYEVRRNTANANIRTIAGSTADATIIAQMRPGTEIRVTETTVISGTTWGKFEIDVDFENAVFFGPAGGGTAGNATSTGGNPGRYTAWASFVVFHQVVPPAPEFAPWNFSTAIDRDLTLFAQWNQTHGAITFNTACQGANGTLIAKVDDAAINTGALVQLGKDITFTATPNTGQRVRHWTVNGTIVDDFKYETKTLTVAADKTVTVTFESITGLGDVMFANLQIFPNPFVSELKITGAENSKLEVINVLGTVVHTQQISSSSETIQLNGLSSGIYFFRLSKDGQSRTMQVIRR